MGSAISLRGVSCWYGENQALAEVNLEIPENCIFAFIGPSGCGKTTLLRSINRLNDLVSGFRLSGTVEVGGQDVYALAAGRQVENLRRRIGMIFQQPNPLPTSIWKNMYLPVDEFFRVSENELQELAESKLRAAGLFDEVADRLTKSAQSLSGGQQQRLCIARALMLDPEIMLLDEPCSALDPIATMKIEDLLSDFKRSRTIIIVTHNMEQAQRIADYTAFFYNGRIVEAGPTLSLFSKPKTELLDQYVRRRFAMDETAGGQSGDETADEAAGKGTDEAKAGVTEEKAAGQAAEETAAGVAALG